MNVGLPARILATVTILLALPRGGWGQEPDDASLLRLDARLGFAGHYGGIGVGGTTAYYGEFALRTRGPIVLGVGIGVSYTVGQDIQAIGHITEFEGQTVNISSGPFLFESSPRFRGLAGYSFELQNELRIEPTVEGGFAQWRGEEKKWPWALGAIAVRAPSGFGVQLGFGRHRVGVRYHALEPRALVHEFYEWEDFTEFLFSVPLN